MGKLFFLVGSLCIGVNHLLPDWREDAKDKADSIAIRQNWTFWEALKNLIRLVRISMMI